MPREYVPGVLEFAKADLVDRSIVTGSIVNVELVGGEYKPREYADGTRRFLLD
jgi:hypothetical protein